MGMIRRRNGQRSLWDAVLFGAPDPRKLMEPKLRVVDELLNDELVRAGLAHAKLGYNYSSAMKRRFADAQKEAQRDERGIWSHTDSDEESTAH